MKISDSKKIHIARWYLAGVVYFFVAMGTPLGQRLSTLDLVFTLSATIALLTVFLFDPIVYRMFDVTRKGRKVNAEYLGRKGVKAYSYKLLQLFRCMLIVILVAATYHLVNAVLVQVLDPTPGTIYFKGEAFSFATFYSVYYWISDLLINSIRRV